jgi:hypothetical protein
MKKAFEALDRRMTTAISAPHCGHVLDASRWMLACWTMNWENGDCVIGIHVALP